MRIWKELSGATAAFAVAIVTTPAAEAQSVFQKLFGFAGPTPQPGPIAPPSFRQSIPAYRFHSHTGVRPGSASARRDRTEDDDIGPPDSGGPYRTVCVRTCDGFYFPLRHNAVRKNFASDIRSCRNACGSDARLFYYSLQGPEGPDAMVDLGGKKYSELAHAFTYRKSLVSGCVCKPVPWSGEEAARHKTYADQEDRELAKDVAFVKAGAATAQAKSETTDAMSDTVAKIDPQDTTDPVAEPAPDLAPSTIDAVPEDASSPDTQSANPETNKPVIERKETPAIVPRPARRRAKSFARINIERVRYRPSAPTSIIRKSRYVWRGYSR